MKGVWPDTKWQSLSKAVRPTKCGQPSPGLRAQEKGHPGVGVGQPSGVPELEHSKRGTCTEGSLVRPWQPGPAPWEVRRVPHKAGVCCQSINTVR